MFSSWICLFQVNYIINSFICPLLYKFLTDIAVFFNVSPDYLVAIDKEEMVSVDGSLRAAQVTVPDLRHNSKTFSINSWLSFIVNISYKRPNSSGRFIHRCYSFVTVFCSSAVVYLRVGTSLTYQNGRGLLTHSKQTNPLANHSKK